MSNTKKQLKTVIIKAPKVAKFDLTMKKPHEAVRILEAIASLKVNAGWQFLTQVFNENIAFLAKQIISKADENGKALTDAQIDVLRIKHAYLEELVAKPDTFVKRLSRQDSEVPDLDPYDKGNRPTE